MPNILYQDLPPGANEQAIAQGTGQSFWDGLLRREDVSPEPYATLEPGYWKLDGSRRLLEDQPSGEGYCSLVPSGEDGAFVQPVELTVVLDKTYTATGLTLTFDGAGEEWCSQLEVRWYRDTQLLAQEKVIPTEAHCLVSRLVTAFDKVVLTFYGTSCPGRFLRLDSLILGQQRTFDASEIQDLELHAQVDISGLTLAGGTARFDLALEDNLELFFQQGQIFKVFQKNSLKGTYYLDEAQKTGPGQYQVECVDGIGLLTDGQTLGGLYRNAPFRQVVQELLGEEVPFRIQDELADIALNGWIAAGTKRDGLLQAAFGAGALVTVEPEGTLFLKKLPDAAESVILKKQIFQGGTTSSNAPYTQVELTASEYLPGERKTVYSGETQAGKQTVLTKDPEDEYQITGGEILDSGANFVTFQVDTPGPVTITGRQQERLKTRFSTQMEGVEESARSNILSGEGTMVSPDRAAEILKRLVTYGQNSQTLRQTVVNEELKPGDYVTTEKSFDGQLVGYILSVTTHLTGNSVSDLEILGRSVDLDSVASYCGTVFAGEG